MPSLGPTLGLDIGGTSVKAAVLRADGSHALAQSEPYTRPDTATLRAAIDQALAQLGAEPDRCGLCVPGRLSDDGAAVQRSVNLPGLEGVPLRELVPVREIVVVSDAHAATHDYWCAHKPEGRLLGVAIGTGVGACVLDDGVPLRVEGATPGHLGQIDVGPCAPDEPVGPDGGRNGLEAYLGLPALRARFGDEIPTDGPHVTALVRAIRIAHAIYRPRTVVLLGGVGLALRPALGAIEAAVRADLTSLADPAWTLAAGDHAHHAALGAARLASSSTTERADQNPT